MDRLVMKSEMLDDDCKPIWNFEA